MKRWQKADDIISYHDLVFSAQFPLISELIPAHVYRNGGTGDPTPAIIKGHYQPYERKKCEQSRIPQNTKTSAQIGESIRLNGQNEGRS
jgi:hypothetical protein